MSAISGPGAAARNFRARNGPESAAQPSGMPSLALIGIEFQGGAKGPYEKDNFNIFLSDGVRSWLLH